MFENVTKIINLSHLKLPLSSKYDSYEKSLSRIAAKNYQRMIKNDFKMLRKEPFFINKAVSSFSTECSAENVFPQLDIFIKCYPRIFET